MNKHENTILVLGEKVYTLTAANERLREMLQHVDVFVLTDSEHCPFCGFIGRGWKGGRAEHKKGCELVKALRSE